MRFTGFDYKESYIIGELRVSLRGVIVVRILSIGLAKAEIIRSLFNVQRFTGKLKNLMDPYS